MGQDGTIVYSFDHSFCAERARRVRRAFVVAFGFRVSWLGLLGRALRPDPHGGGGPIWTQCTGGKECRGGKCVCVPNHHQRCNNGDVYWFDSCHRLGALFQDCPRACCGGQCREFCGTWWRLGRRHAGCPLVPRPCVSSTYPRSLLHW